MRTFDHDQAYPLRCSPSPKCLLIKTPWYTRISFILLNLIIVYISTGRARIVRARIRVRGRLRKGVEDPNGSSTALNKGV